MRALIFLYGLMTLTFFTFSNQHLQSPHFNSVAASAPWHLIYTNVETMLNNMGFTEAPLPGGFVSAYPGTEVHYWVNGGDTYTCYVWESWEDLEDWLPSAENNCSLKAESWVDENGNKRHQCSDPGNECRVVPGNGGTDAVDIVCCDE